MTVAHSKWSKACAASAVLLLSGLAVPTAAQEAPPEPEGERVEQTATQNEDLQQAATQNEGLQQSARTADTGIGEVGQRQNVRDGAALQEPLDRIASRINNRVQNRLRNRIDRNYDPTANATSPYLNADSQTRASRVTGPR